MLFLKSVFFFGVDVLVFIWVAMMKKCGVLHEFAFCFGIDLCGPLDGPVLVSGRVCEI